MTVGRKLKHVEVCLTRDVEYQTRTTGLERLDLSYRALPEIDLRHIDMRTTFLGKELAAPFLVGAMTGGARLSHRINANLAEAAERLGVGMMLGSQRVMIEDPSARPSFEVRGVAPSILLLGNLGVAQLNRGYGVGELQRAVDEVGADGIAIHTNPLQEAVQTGGDTDFRDLAARLAEVVPKVGHPVVLKEVGHGLSATTAHAVERAGFAALDVAGAGGTSWARVEELAKFGQVRDPDLVEWGIPTATALREVRNAAPHTPIVASGGIRSGLDMAKAIALGASVCAVALPLLQPATESADAVAAVIDRYLTGLRIAMFGAGCADLAALRAVPLRVR